ncbi:hypothetical protein ACF044_11410 [Microbacterium sp. NPDC016588]
MAAMDDEVLRLGHEEILRLRERQVARITSMRGRAGGILGASGIAASLAGALGDNGAFALPVGCFMFATIYAVKSLRVQSVTVRHPVGVLSALVDKSPFEGRLELIKQLRTEYDRAEAKLSDIATALQVAMGWFIAGTAVLFLVAGVIALIPVSGVTD